MLFRLQFNKRNEHFFHGNAPVLEGVAVVVDEVVVVIRIDKEIGFPCKDIFVGDFDLRQEGLRGFIHDKHFFFIIAEPAAYFVA